MRIELNFWKLMLSLLVVAIACPGFSHSQEGNGTSIDKEEAEAEQAFMESLHKVIGLKPKETQIVVQEVIQQEKATRIPAPEGLKTKFQVVSLRPGAAINTVYLRPNYTTTFLIQDTSGAPWPIKSALQGNADFLHIIQHEGGDRNVISVVPKVYAANVGMLVMLEPSVPLNLQIIVDSNKVPDQQVTLRVDKPGPNVVKQTRVIKKPMVVTDSIMMQFLYGVPPEGASLLAYSNASIEGWAYRGHYYTRSPLKLYWPSFEDVVESGDGSTGVNVYKTQPQDALLFVEKNGTPISVEVTQVEIQ